MQGHKLLYELHYKKHFHSYFAITQWMWNQMRTLGFEVGLAEIHTSLREIPSPGSKLQAGATPSSWLNASGKFSHCLKRYLLALYLIGKGLRVPVWLLPYSCHQGSLIHHLSDAQTKQNHDLVLSWTKKVCCLLRDIFFWPTGVRREQRWGVSRITKAVFSLPKGGGPSCSLSENRRREDKGIILNAEQQ